MSQSNLQNPVMTQPVLVYGDHDTQTVDQLERCVRAEDGARGVLCADGHVGYSMPIGGVVAYKNFISPSGVGYDIACGNLAVKTSLQDKDINTAQYERIADEIQRRISFGMGRNNNEPVDNPVFDRIAHSPIREQRALVQLAKNQLGTVGSGNHYVDLLVDPDGYVWVGVHFGSRGVGHKTATMFMNVAKGLAIDAKSKDGEMHSPPLLLDIHQPSGQDYIEAMEIAGAFAYAGREEVVAKVLEILGSGTIYDHIHNHHNFAWKETHSEQEYWVVRKGATPAGPGVRGFVGGSMGDISVILHGRESVESAALLYSTVHGAGRVMSRNQAIKGKHEWFCPERKLVGGGTPGASRWLEEGTGCLVRYQPPQRNPPKDMKCPVHGKQLLRHQLTPPIDFREVQENVRSQGVILRGAGPDEAPGVYRPLRDVLAAHGNTIEIETMLKPRVVVMAGKDVHDPYKD